MLDLTGHGRLAQLSELTDRIIGEASKNAIVTAASILKIQVGHYQHKFGVIPFNEAMDLLEAERLSEDQAGWVTNELKNLTAVLFSMRNEGPG